MAYTSDKTLYHDGNGNASESGGKGWELLVRKGGTLRDADAARFGLIEPPKRKAKKADPYVYEAETPAETAPKAQKGGK